MLEGGRISLDLPNMRSVAAMTFDELLRTGANQARAWSRFARQRLAPHARQSVSRTPAFDPETTAWFLARIAKSRHYVEYGAGASTLLAADAGAASVSIESDPVYAQAVREALPRPPSAHSNRVVTVDIGRTEDWGYPVWIIPTGRSRARWRRYPEAGPAALDRLGGFPDLVLVDGRFRIACCLAMALAAVERRATTQILFDDYAGRPHYARVEAQFGKPRLIGRAALFDIDGAKLDAVAIQQIYSGALSDYT